jgi:hypothetical protein
MAMHTGEPMPYRTAATRDLVAVQRAPDGRDAARVQPA